ncbi:hypothetical protein BU23DRAFT_598989 [Bimuria novae-zelandiae CBS 107.79]|uniref:Kinesin light chain n=1 Tax=Bimuria novae-zelandiae CBS 107.79 TaxID=1447943 RepID=A0A6A5V775_9PLEO|nr:hypothetical protein BU23DRAFT_598989 [Bimuria novae-zelandiae CBS 107.79]
MAPPAFFALPNSPDVARLVQDRLSRVQQRFSACSPSTLSDLRTVVDELSTISKTCATVLDDIETQEGETDVATAFKELEAALDWAKFLQYVQTEHSPAEHPFLFRAHRNMTVLQFVRAMAVHMGKTQLQKGTGMKQDTMFTSMSPIFEWALHTTKNKWSDNNADERASLVVFDVRRLRQIQGVALFRISDVIRFLESENQVHMISAQLRDWARNCDEYVTMGRAVKDAVVRVIPWSELQSIPIINDPFIRAYTLGRYRQWRDEREYRLHDGEEVGKIVVRSANVLAGHDAPNTWMAQHMVELILKPGVSFWGINTNASGTDVSNQGRWKEAEELEVQVVQTTKRVLGDEHPHTLGSMNNLAATYSNQGRWKEAEELGVQVMQTTKRVLGDEHPDTLTSMHNLAFTLQSQARHGEAFALMKRCSQLREQVLGEQHPDTQSSLDTLSD